MNDNIDYLVSQINSLKIELIEENHYHIRLNHFNPQTYVYEWRRCPSLNPDPQRTCLSNDDIVVLHIFLRCHRHLDHPRIVEAFKSNLGFLAYAQSDEITKWLILNNKYYLLGGMNEKYKKNKEFMLDLIRLDPSTIQYTLVIDDEIVKTTLISTFIKKLDNGKFFTCVGGNRVVKVRKFNKIIYPRFYKDYIIKNNLMDYCLMFDGEFINTMKRHATKERVLLAVETYPELASFVDEITPYDYKKELIRRNRAVLKYFSMGVFDESLNYKQYDEVCMFNITFSFI